MRVALLGQVPAVLGSNLTPLKAYPEGDTLVDVPVLAGVSEVYQLTVCWLMALGLLGFGKVPTAWSGMPLADNDRSVELQLQADLLVKPAVLLGVVSL